MEFSESIFLLQQFLQCGNQVALWHYDANGDLIDSNYPQKELLSVAFTAFGCKERMLEHAQDHSNPILLGDSLGLTWGAAFRKSGGMQRQVLHGRFICWIMFLTFPSAMSSCYHIIS